MAPERVQRFYGLCGVFEPEHSSHRSIDLFPCLICMGLACGQERTAFQAVEGAAA